jgi:hypothetical protein
MTFSPLPFWYYYVKLLIVFITVENWNQTKCLSLLIVSNNDENYAATWNMLLSGKRYRVTLGFVPVASCCITILKLRGLKQHKIISCKSVG